MNDVRIHQDVLLEIFDGDTLTFGQSVRGSPEFYFLFQKVCVSPEDFDAITVPKASSFSSNIKNRIRTSVDSKPEPNLDISKLSINKATVILNSIGSLSKINGTNWSFRRADKTTNRNTASKPSFEALVTPSTPPTLCCVAREAIKSALPSSKSRRKSAHTVLLEDDCLDDPVGCRTETDDARKARGGKRRRLYKSESDLVQHTSKMDSNPGMQFDTRAVLPKQNGLQYNQMNTGRLNSFSFTSIQKQDLVNMSHHKIVVGCRQQKTFPLASRGRRRANSTPLCTPLVVGGENYQLTYPAVRIQKAERGKIARLHTSTG